MTRTMTASALLLGTLIAIALPAMAQERDPAYAAARAAGQIGELPDGYLGVGGAPPTERNPHGDNNNIHANGG